MPVKSLADVKPGQVRLAACQITRNVIVSRDIAQNVMGRLHTMPPQKLASIECLQAYADKAARNEALNWLRDRSHYASGDQLGEVQAGREFDPAISACNEDEALDALSRLPEQERVPFILCKMFGFSAEEVAEKLRISVELVWKRIQKALERLEKAGIRTRPLKSRNRSEVNRKEQP